MSRPDLWYGGLTGDEITPDRGVVDSAPVGSVRSDPLDSQLADRLEETYRQLLAAWTNLGC